MMLFGQGGHKKGRKITTQIVGTKSFSFELPLICFLNSFDINKVCPKLISEFSFLCGSHLPWIYILQIDNFGFIWYIIANLQQVLEIDYTKRLENWTLELRERTSDHTQTKGARDAVRHD